MTTKARVSDKLMMLRVKSGLSAREVSERAGVSAATVLRYELAQVDMTIDIVGCIIGAYGMSLAEFFEGIPAEKYSGLRNFSEKL